MLRKLHNFQSGLILEDVWSVKSTTAHSSPSLGVTAQYSASSLALAPVTDTLSESMPNLSVADSSSVGPSLVDEKELEADDKSQFVRLINHLTHGFRDESTEKEYQHYLAGLHQFPTLFCMFAAIMFFSFGSYESYSAHDPYNIRMIARMIAAIDLSIAAAYSWRKETFSRRYPFVHRQSLFLLLVLATMERLPTFTSYTSEIFYYICLTLTLILRSGYWLSFLLTVMGLSALFIVTIARESIVITVCTAAPTILCILTTDIVVRRIDLSSRRTFFYAQVIKKNHNSIQRDKQKTFKLITSVYPRPVIGQILDSRSSEERLYEAQDCFVLAVKFNSNNGQGTHSITSERFGSAYKLVFQCFEKNGVHRIKTAGGIILGCCGLFSDDQSPETKIARLIYDLQSPLSFHNITAKKGGYAFAVCRGRVKGGIVQSSLKSFDIVGPAVTMATQLVRSTPVSSILCDEATANAVGEFFSASPISKMIGGNLVQCFHLQMPEMNLMAPPEISMAELSKFDIIPEHGPSQLTAEDIGRHLRFGFIPDYGFSSSDLEEDYRQRLRSHSSAKLMRIAIVLICVGCVLHGIIDYWIMAEFSVEYDYLWNPIVIRYSLLAPCILLSSLAFSMSAQQLHRLTLHYAHILVMVLYIFYLGIRLALNAQLSLKHHLPYRSFMMYTVFEMYEWSHQILFMFFLTYRQGVCFLLVWCALFTLYYIVWGSKIGPFVGFYLAVEIFMYVLVPTVLTLMGLISREEVYRSEFVTLKQLNQKTQEAATEKDLLEDTLSSVVPRSILEDIHAKKQGKMIRQTVVLLVSLCPESFLTRFTSMNDAFAALGDVILFVERMCVSYKLEFVKSMGTNIWVRSTNSDGILQAEIMANLAFDIAQKTFALRSTESSLPIWIYMSFGEVLGGIFGSERFTFDIVGHVVDECFKEIYDGPPNIVQIGASLQSTFSKSRNFTVRKIPQNSFASQECKKYYIEKQMDIWRNYISYIDWMRDDGGETIEDFSPFL